MKSMKEESKKLVFSSVCVWTSVVNMPQTQKNNNKDKWNKNGN